MKYFIIEINYSAFAIPATKENFDIVNKLPAWQPVDFNYQERKWIVRKPESCQSEIKIVDTLYTPEDIEVLKKEREEEEAEKMERDNDAAAA